jgi:hypothetical protein
MSSRSISHQLLANIQIQVAHLHRQLRLLLYHLALVNERYTYPKRMSWLERNLDDIISEVVQVSTDQRTVTQDIQSQRLLRVPLEPSEPLIPLLMRKQLLFQVIVIVLHRPELNFIYISRDPQIQNHLTHPHPLLSFLSKRPTPLNPDSNSFP